MADELETEQNIITPEPDASVAQVKPKKQRATRLPKSSKADVEASPVKVTRSYRKRESADTAATPAAVKLPAFGDPDDFASLLSLEEENKALRKELSEKLRAENADLRKRLGKA